ncbi:Putative MerR-family transcriptional regulator [Halomicronema hongdechloris C2206]|uniref:MerR-family transcriptional regulator n=1 Tax=Halomicronema hongdechloris C2206 TaxID=1641165 RepID=A0A1Z3HUR5_9CYAN|nr:class I SAM-dependent methyltransferase [Halomicronema hongdechloris]ASC74015.1 Putative MerR-family transcriptional regulator [Halomicronema hongdechloris C2206]
MDPASLHTRNPLGRFSDRAEDYARYRPGYPEDAIASILAGLGDPSRLQIADIGAGTGISSRLLAATGATVIAVEPNQAMAAAAEPHPRVRFRQGQAEATGLDHDAVGLVTCCQSFHWCEPMPALDEFSRILQPGGRLALMWNDWELSDPLTAAYRQLVQIAADREFINHYYRHGLEALRRHPRFAPVRHLSMTYPQPLTLAALIGRSLSASYMPKQGPAYEQFLEDVTALYERWTEAGAALTLVYQTNLYLAELR